MNSPSIFSIFAFLVRLLVAIVGLVLLLFGLAVLLSSCLRHYTEPPPLPPHNTQYHPDTTPHDFQGTPTRPLHGAPQNGPRFIPQRHPLQAEPNDDIVSAGRRRIWQFPAYSVSTVSVSTVKASGSKVGKAKKPKSSGKLKSPIRKPRVARTPPNEKHSRK